MIPKLVISLVFILVTMSGCLIGSIFGPKKVEHEIVCIEKRASIAYCKEMVEKWQEKN